MKYTALFIPFAISIFPIYAQTKANVSLNLGVNHSGFITQKINSKIQNDFKDNFNPNICISMELELLIKNKLNLVCGIGLRNSGTKYFIPLTSSTNPDDGEKVRVYNHFKQIYFPLLVSYSFGKDYKIIPLLGVVNNYNYSIYARYPISSKQVQLTNFTKYNINALGGVKFCNYKLFNKHLGLGIKVTYERSLNDLDITSTAKISQAIMSGLLMLNYNLE